METLIILDREDDLGGTWHVNRYPGLAVDNPSSTYSYSFEPNPYWSRLYAPGAELKAYAYHVAGKYQLRPLMRFDTLVEDARWDRDAKHWIVAISGAAPITARFLLTATGLLSQPRMPDIDGIETFAGTVIHTTKWDDSHDLTGKRAAVFGTAPRRSSSFPRSPGCWPNRLSISAPRSG